MLVSNVPALVSMDSIGPAIGAVVFVTIMSLVPEPARRSFNAIFAAGVIGVYIGGSFGTWELLCPVLATPIGYLGLRSYKFIGIAWLMHAAWDLPHHLWGKPIWPFMRSSSFGCMIFDSLIAIWFLAGAPSVWRVWASLGSTRTARDAITALLTHINARSSENRACETTVEQICEHFEQRELRSGDSFRSFATVKTHRGYIRKWIRPRWGSFYLDEIKAVEVEAWLRRLSLARSSRAKIRSILPILFNHACRYELFDRNPVRFVRQGAKRRRAPDVLTAAEFKELVDHLPLRERTLALLAASTGLRQSELFGIKWRDVDFQREELSVVRSIVFGVVGRCKTESSQKPVPLHPLLGEALLTWRKTCKFTGNDDWVFASRLHKGRRPYWGAAILRKYIRPVAASLNMQKRIGWHTFRHTYSTLLRSVGAEFKVMQELMRHSTLRTTMDVYTQAVAPAKHAAQAAVLALFFPLTGPVDDWIILGTAKRAFRLEGASGHRNVAFCTFECPAKISASC